MKSSRSTKISRPKRTRARAGGRVLRIVDRVELLRLAFRIVLDDDLQRPQHRHAARRGLVEELADRVLEHRHVDEAVGAGDADPLDEVADRLGRHAAPAEPGKRRHARVVPAGDMAVAHQLGQHALGQHGVAEVQPRELVLARPRRHRQVLDEPVIERPVILEFERAERMGDALDRVGLAVGEIVARIDRARRCRCADGWR